MVSTAQALKRLKVSKSRLHRLASQGRLKRCARGFYSELSVAVVHSELAAWRSKQAIRKAKRDIDATLEKFK